jgi:hypothetical protein
MEIKSYTATALGRGRANLVVGGISAATETRRPGDRYDLAIHTASSEPACFVESLMLPPKSAECRQYPGPQLS